MRATRSQYIILIFIYWILLLSVLFNPVSAAGTETLITTGRVGTNQISPAVSGDIIVWEDNQGGSGSIYLYNAVTGEESKISNPTVSAREPSISGNYVVWYEENTNGQDIYLYTISSGTTTRITNYLANKYHPRISGSKIVWQEEIYDDGSGTYWYDVLLYGIGSGITYNLTSCRVDTLSVPTQSAADPAIEGNNVVWIDWDDARGFYAIIVMDVSPADPTTGAKRIVSEATAVLDPAISFPSAFGPYITWTDQRDGDENVYLNDTSAAPPEYAIPSFPNANIQKYPVISGTRIAYLDDTNLGGSFQIGLYDIDTGSVLYDPLTLTQKVYADNGHLLAFNGSRIVWEDIRYPGGQSDIYMFTDGATDSCPIADFAPASAAGSPPFTVQFISNTTSPLPTHWYWDFGDGTTATTMNATHMYSSIGTFRVNLTAGTSYCRNMSQDHIVSVGPPTVGFTGTPTEGMVPVSVSFSSAETVGSVDTWDWDFGDGSANSSIQHPVHVYTTGGTYTVKLFATNGYGTGSLTRTDYITVKPGIRKTATTTITGISTSVSGSDQILYLDKGLFGAANHTLQDSLILVTKPAPSYGWQNVTFFSKEVPGFSETLSDITGAFRRVFLQTINICPPDFDDGDVGSDVCVNYQMDFFSFPAAGTLTTDVLEGALPSESSQFYEVISDANFASMDIAYSINTARSGIGAPSNTTLNMSVRSSWVGSGSNVATGRTLTHVIAKGYNSEGDHIGVVLPVTFLFNNSVSGYEYFSANIPSSYSYLSKFALAKLSGSGNVFQMVYLGITEHAGENPPSSDSDTGPSPSAGKGTGQGLASQQNQPPLNQPPAVPEPEATSIDLYINDMGVVTQTTVLDSADQLASIAIGQGVTAIDASGAPLSSISMETLSAEHISEMPSSGTLTFAGLAYDFQPDGATFSPAVTITFTVPNAQWGQQYTVREFDTKAGTWIDLPTTYHPESGTISASVSHFCCIALFSSSMPPGATVKGTKTMAAPPEPIPTPAPTSQFGIIYNMIVFIANLIVRNIYLVLVIVAIFGTLYIRGRRGRLDKIRYKM